MNKTHATHKLMNHKVTYSSPNGFDTLEECSECGCRFLHLGLSDGYIRTLPKSTAFFAAKRQAVADGAKERKQEYRRAWSTNTLD